jgi:hypothetical protein
MIVPLARALEYAVVSVRRFLRQVGYFRSYTHNGKWYTLRSIPVFDRHGIWRHEDIGFAKHGNLLQAIAHLLDRSPQGLSARELSELLHHPCQAVLTQMHKAGKLERVQGPRAFVYLSADPTSRRRQLSALPAPVSPEPLPPLPAEAAVFVLVDFIHNPALSERELARRLNKQRGCAVLPEAIAAFFAQHGLKKRPTSGS